MKVMTATAIALASAAMASPAAAQRYGSAPAPQPSVVTPAAPATAGPPKISLSKKVSKAFLELQKAVTANDVANIPAKVAAAQALAETKEDRYAIGQMQLKAALAAKDNAATGAAIDAIATSGFLDGARSAELYNALGIQYYNAKDYARAGTLFERAAALDPRSAEPLRLLAEARNATGRKAEAARLLTQALQLSAAAGQKPAESVYKQAAALAYEAKAPNAVELARQWVAAYPSASSWGDAVAIYRSLNQPSVGSTLDLFRVLRAAGALTTSGQYTLYATAAADQGNFGEAQSVIDEGIAANRISMADRTARDTVSGLKSKPKASPAELEAAVKTAATGASLVRIGDRFYGLGDYARAAELYRQAITKGADASLANLHLGMALARSGDKAGATTALNAVSGTNAEIAKYWLLYVNHAA